MTPAQMPICRQRRFRESIWPGLVVLMLVVLIQVVFSPAWVLAGDGETPLPPPGEIEYGYPDQSIFVATTNREGQPDSPMTRVAEALMTRTGLPWRAKAYPARRLFDNLEKGITPFAILVRATSLLDSCLFSRRPVYSTHLNLYYLDNTPPVASREALAGTHLITIRGYSYGGLLKLISDPANQIRNEVASTHRAAFQMLSHRRADYLLDYASAAADILAERPVPGIRATALARLDIFLVVSKAYPGARALMNRLEKIAETLDVDAILNRKETR